MQVRAEIADAAVAYIADAVLFGTPHDTIGQPALGTTVDFVPKYGLVNERPAADFAPKTTAEYPLPQQTGQTETVPTDKTLTPDEADRQRRIAEARRLLAAQPEAVREQDDRDNTSYGFAA